MLIMLIYQRIQRNTLDMQGIQQLEYGRVFIKKIASSKYKDICIMIPSIVEDNDRMRGYGIGVISACN